MSKKCTYSILETAEILGIGKTLCYELVNNGTIPTIKLGTKRLITRKALSKILEGNSTATYIEPKDGEEC